jgi:hypothetical protein
MHVALRQCKRFSEKRHAKRAAARLMACGRHDDEVEKV